MCLFPGGTVHMVCRNEDKAEEAREDIVNESGNTVSVALSLTNPMICEGEYDTHLVIIGGIHPYCGHGGDTQSLGVCRGLQAAVSIPECVGRYCPSPLIFIPAQLG